MSILSKIDTRLNLTRAEEETVERKSRTQVAEILKMVDGMV